MKMTANKKRAAELLKAVGEPNAVARDLRRFRKAARALSSDHPRLIDRYPQKWVAVYDDQVLAADDLHELLAQVDAKGISRQKIIVRHIDRNDRVLIL